MANHLETDTQPSLSELVNGIIHDAHDLMTQQLKLFQVEIKNDVRKMEEAARPLLLGTLLSLVGAVALAFGAAFFISWAWPSIPLWGGLAIVGGGLLLGGVALGLWGKCRLDACNTVLDEPVDLLKENIPWKMKN